MKNGYLKLFFYVGCTCLIVFEFLKAYFILPMPGSQESESINLAYDLHSYRWVFRIVFFAFILSGIKAAFQSKNKWPSGVILLIALVVAYFFNFKMSADKMFLQITTVTMKPRNENKVSGTRLVIAVENNGQAKAYPIEFLTYHHQVQDTVGGKPILVTYCNVCRSGRVYEPIVNGHYDKFRLVGMDHFNAMLEDGSTGSWWRQSTGEAIAGKMKGAVLREFESRQMTVNKWFELYPNALIMQPDKAFLNRYDSLARFEQGKIEGGLTGTDTLSWKSKSWVIGVHIGNLYKAYDWNQLKKEKIINDEIGKTPILLILLSDGQNFAAFERPSNEIFAIRNDTLFSNEETYDVFGRKIKEPSKKLKNIKAYQEFLHSWNYFHPDPMSKK